MNPYLIIAALVAVMGAAYGGFTLGVDHEQASQARQDDVVRKVVEEVNTATAVSLSKISVKNTTIRQELEREIKTNTVYRDCSHSDDGLRIVNEALTGNARPAGDRKLPGTDTLDGSILRGDDPKAGGRGRAVPAVPNGGAEINP